MQSYHIKGEIMDITKYPQFQLYLLTLHIFNLKNQLIPKNCDEWCINASIINRAYYSAYLYCALWLEFMKNFKVKKPWDYDDEDERIGEHKQIREALHEFGEDTMRSELKDLFTLRSKADYEPFVEIASQEVTDAIHHMEKIFNHLKFE